MRSCDLSVQVANWMGTVHVLLHIVLFLMLIFGCFQSLFIAIPTTLAIGYKAFFGKKHNNRS